MTTLNNRAKAMNAVHKFCKAVAEDAQKLFPVGDHSMYKNDGSLTKKVNGELHALFESVGTSDLQRVTVETRYNSVSFKACATYDRVNANGDYESTGYYEMTVYLVAKQSAKYGGEYVLNEPCNIQHILDLNTRWTAKRLKSHHDRIFRLDEKIRELQAEKSQLSYWVE